MSNAPIPYSCNNEEVFNNREEKNVKFTTK
jgi:hypothetical protein